MLATTDGGVDMMVVVGGAMLLRCPSITHGSNASSCGLAHSWVVHATPTIVTLSAPHHAHLRQLQVSPQITPHVAFGTTPTTTPSSTDPPDFIVNSMGLWVGLAVAR
jgi:hypothetical protein